MRRTRRGCADAYRLTPPSPPRRRGLRHFLTADCLPVLLCDTAGRVVGAAHAGWRGLAGGVLENTASTRRDAGAGELLAWLGPAIGPERFDVGEDVLQAFAGRHAAGGARISRRLPKGRENIWPTFMRWRVCGWNRRACTACSAVVTVPSAMQRLLFLPARRRDRRACALIGLDHPRSR